jgi:hypothetical protein
LPPQYSAGGEVDEEVIEADADLSKSLRTLSQMSSPCEMPLVAFTLSPIAARQRLGRYQPRSVKG